MNSDINCSVDRITIVGTLDTVSTTFTKLLTPTNNGFKFGESIFIQLLGNGRWRFDFNPNHLNSKDKNDIRWVLAKLKDKNLSRVDIAIDFFDFPDFMNYRYSNTKKSEIWFSQSKKIETIYYGSFKSRFLIRQYDKLVEQKKRGNTIPYEEWGRFEVQLRNEYTKKWQDLTMKVCQKIVYMDNMDIPYYERSILHSLKDNTISWSDLSAPTARKYRQISLKTNKSIAIQKKLKKLISSNLLELQTTINTYI